MVKQFKLRFLSLGLGYFPICSLLVTMLIFKDLMKFLDTYHTPLM